jgi:hypothetical protein
MEAVDERDKEFSMTLKRFFLVNSIISVFFSLALLLMPATILELFSMPNNAATKVLLQFYGVQLLGGGLITLFAINTKELRSQRSLTLAFFIADGVGFIVALGGLLSGAMNLLGWGIALAYLILALGFGYFQFIGPTN